MQNLQEKIIPRYRAVKNLQLSPSIYFVTAVFLACFQEMMQKHIRKNFRYPEIAQEMGVQGRVNVMFTIQKDGSIGNIRYRGPDKNLEAEALRIIEKLPRMTPGKQRGRAVRVPFSIPITFKLQ